ncbi:ArsR/SmtB family transcription factor [Streptomyces luteolus]|uniref:Metalloregulator ArsR/SmtB family transcription factor n=1 Tax=Streptomyces luteolus TaxID=3043615 RepID=A0ABT6SXM9_9ACTN|nr:metalloregulator ArsR/SmtB family transcription factor [Streptomyces sp. B-S-A12]MDI3420367.1 metalloregulator ArsR/SmtB family transcription factor [Streptomyces sp. B-S-A12]
MDVQQTSARRDAAVVVLKAVADSTRFTVLWELTQGERAVGQLAELAGAQVAAVSQHLARLRTAGLVTSRRVGTHVYYRAAGEHVRALLEHAVLVAEAVEEAPGPGRRGSVGH